MTGLRTTDAKGNARALVPQLACTALVMVVAGWLSAGERAWVQQWAAGSMSFAVAGAIAVAAFAARHWRGERFGLANSLTWMRMLMMCCVAGALSIREPSTGLVWTVVGLSLLANILDGFDGWLARRLNEESRFGARFDMEVDALLILTLSILAYLWDRAGLWILLAGLMRYAFVASAVIWPWLAQPLGPSSRRRFVCVVQTAALIGCLLPWWSPTTAHAIAFSGLMALACSFAIDVRDLYRERSQNDA